MRKGYIVILVLICLIVTGCDKTISETIRNKTYTFIRNDKNLIISKDQFTFQENGRGIEKVIIDTTPNDNKDTYASKEYKFNYEIDNNNSEIKIIYSNTEIILKYNPKTKCIENENKDEYCVIKGE